MLLLAAAALAAGAPGQLLESAGKLPRFTLHGADLEAPGMLEKVVSQVAYRGEVILVCGDAKPTASSANGLNTILQLRALRLHYVLYLSDSAASCASLRGALPDVACVWSSRISAAKPKDGGLCVQLYWGYAFYFYDLRKHYLARMTIELGLNVLQTDTDVVWLANPYAPIHALSCPPTLTLALALALALPSPSPSPSPTPSPSPPGTRRSRPSSRACSS